MRWEVLIKRTIKFPAYVADGQILALEDNDFNAKR